MCRSGTDDANDCRTHPSGCGYSSTTTNERADPSCAGDSGSDYSGDCGGDHCRDASPKHGTDRAAYPEGVGLLAADPTRFTPMFQNDEVTVYGVR